MTARVLSVNVSRGGIPKLPIPRGKVGVQGLDGDEHAHPRIHGGPAKAILLITAEGLEELRPQGYQLYPGALGENLTVKGLDRKKLRIGQRYRVGAEVVIEIRSVREPCVNLEVYGKEIQGDVYDASVKKGNTASERWGLSGFYCSVAASGTVRAGDLVVLLDQSA